ncbi:c-type cytochrome [Mariniflexile litorale]|uniref:C-type cytochrome n=1 Tax=Mariniflexile litorale TaxID=3045158 RepID=A0AAU7EG21_9FLAO|nr:c-type cytochrome [Mariniflexile sp. KMM 9835]MDQ8211810.1 hypothetical protein [Mariniflexile sp. KMM 9835]
MKLSVFIWVLFFSTMGCKNKQSDADYKSSTDFYNKTVESHPGKKLMETYCYACHDATTSEETRLAPPMIAIKRRYIFKNTTQEAFTNDMQNWIKNPNEINAKMFGAVKRFGIMPKILYPEKDIEQIADFIFNNDIEQPEWFEEHYNQNMGKGMR